MKNQNDLIVSIVAIVILLIVVGVAWGTKVEPRQPTPPTEVTVAPPQLPTQVAPVMANGLPSGGNAGGGAAGGPASGRMPGPSSPKGSKFGR